MSIENGWRQAEPGEVNTRKQTHPRWLPPPEIEVQGKTLVTTKKAAELAYVALSTVYRWIREGRRPHYRRGYWIRVDPADLEGI